jgi:tRNA-2-methylthio-N6-dimethylallyladenosine synthase
METLDVQTKIHDETRQGEAYAPFAVNNNQYQKRFYIESYGCAMNFSDSEIVASILQDEGFGATKNFEEADLILINTCSIREKAEQTVRKRLTEFKQTKKQKGTLIGVLGCMAERLKAKLLEEEKLVDLVIGPDAYRTLPALIEEAESGQKAVNVLLSREETYADIAPVRLNSNGVTAFVSIMRGCNNMCSFCVVPFTRGRERSRDAYSIVAEATELFNQGYREVTLLGQNVDSYYWTNPDALGDAGAEVITFANLLEKVALISPLLRVRFSTSHPKDITDDVLFTMAKYANICNYIHLPVQSGSTRVLQLMNRTYTREWYLAKVNRIKEILPGCGLSTDIIAGFCTETEEDHQDTLSLIDYCRFDLAYMYFYSERPGTLAAKRYTDDVPEDVKK